MRHNLKWFTDRIGKTIYRTKLRCKCKSCQSISLKIWDGIDDSGNRGMSRESHAKYLCDCQGMLGISYFDKPVKD